jgi:hypothetical protein
MILSFFIVYSIISSLTSNYDSNKRDLDVSLIKFFIAYLLFV